eukprot:scaffold268930_cov20-Prasinocladus_malaysianus.AAC.1
MMTYACRGERGGEEGPAQPDDVYLPAGHLHVPPAGPGGAAVSLHGLLAHALLGAVAGAGHDAVHRLPGRLPHPRRHCQEVQQHVREDWTALQRVRITPFSHKFPYLY